MQNPGPHAGPSVNSPSPHSFSSFAPDGTMGFSAAAVGIPKPKSARPIRLRRNIIGSLSSDPRQGGANPSLIILQSAENLGPDSQVSKIWFTRPLQPTMVLARIPSIRKSYLLTLPSRTAMKRNLLNGLLLVGVFMLSQDASPPASSRLGVRVLLETKSTLPCLANYHEFNSSAIKVAVPDVQQPDEFSCGAASLM